MSDHSRKTLRHSASGYLLISVIFGEQFDNTFVKLFSNMGQCLYTTIQHIWKILPHMPKKTFTRMFIAALFIMAKNE